MGAAWRVREGTPASFTISARVEGDPVLQGVTGVQIAVFAVRHRGKGRVHEAAASGTKSSHRIRRPRDDGPRMARNLLAKGIALRFAVHRSHATLQELS